jgi:hypothetical protein
MAMTIVMLMMTATVTMMTMIDYCLLLESNGMSGDYIFSFYIQ